MTDQLFPPTPSVTPADRSHLKNHLPLVVWLTGYSGSGKSTIANALEYRLVHEFHAHTYLLDGDSLRSGLNQDLGFSDADRTENIRRVGQLARLFFDAGLIVITAFISPFQSDRDKVRALLPPSAFWEVYVSCPLEICIQRDPKNLYHQASAGAIANFTGLTSPYQPPSHPELVLPTDQLTVEECVQQLVDRMLSLKVIQR